MPRVAKRTADICLSGMVGGALLAENWAAGLRQQLVLGPLYALMQRLLSVPRLDRNRPLQDHRSRIDTVVDEVHGGPGDCCSRRQGVPHRMGAGEAREQRGMQIDEASLVGVDELRRQDPHEAGGYDQVGIMAAHPLEEDGAPLSSG